MNAKPCPRDINFRHSVCASHLKTHPFYLTLHQKYKNPICLLHSTHLKNIQLACRHKILNSDIQLFTEKDFSNVLILYHKD